MTENQIVRLIVAGLSAVPALAPAVIGLLRPDVARSVREQLAAARATMDAAPSPTPAIEALVAGARAAYPRISAHHADVLEHLSVQSALDHEEQRATREVAAMLREMTASEPPRNPFDPPSR